MKVCAVVAAAGLSSRMGAFKPLLPIDGQPAIVHLLQTFLSAGVSQVILVTGYRHAELAQICHPIQQVTCVQNPDFARSQMFDSVRLGLSAVPKSYKPRALHTGRYSTSHPADCAAACPRLRSIDVPQLPASARASHCAQCRLDSFRPALYRAKWAQGRIGCSAGAAGISARM